MRMNRKRSSCASASNAMSSSSTLGFHGSAKAPFFRAFWGFLTVVVLLPQVLADVGVLEGIRLHGTVVVVDWNGGGYLQGASDPQGPWNYIYLAEDPRPRRFELQDGNRFFRVYQTPVEQQLEELARLRQDLRSGDPAIRLAAQGRLTALSSDPEWQDAFELERFFDIAEALDQGKGTPEQTSLLSRNIPAILAEQRRARIGSDPQLQGLRDSFERTLAMTLLAPGPVRDPIDVELGRLSAKVLDYVVKTRSGDPVEVDKALYQLHSDVSSGFGGSLRTPGMVEAAGEGRYADSSCVMREVMQEGNIRERFRMLIRFLMLMGRDALDEASPAHQSLHRIAADPVVVGDPGFGAEEAIRLLDRVALYRLEHPAPWQQTATSSNILEVFYPSFEEAKPGVGIHADHARAQTERYQSKLPGLLEGDVSRFLGLPPPSAPGRLTPSADDNPLARTLLSVRQGQQQGFFLSQREIEALGGLDSPMKWAVGSRANLVLPSAEFLATALSVSLPIKCGVSGTTYRVLSATKILGGDPILIRLAVIAALLSTDSHSLHEVCTSAKGFGAPYDPRKPYANLGISESVLEAIAASLGTTLAELNAGSSGRPVRSREGLNLDNGVHPLWMPLSGSHSLGWETKVFGMGWSDLIDPAGRIPRPPRSFHPPGWLR